MANALDRATVRQKKTGRPVKFELTDHTRAAIDSYLRVKSRTRGDYLFGGRKYPGCHSFDPTIRTAGRRLVFFGRSGSASIRHAFATPNEGDIDLSSDR
jgi:hypothetical protein